MELGLTGKKILVTASGRGIGLATAESFLREGADVVINGRNKAALEETTTELSKKYKGHIYGYAGNMLDMGSIHGIVDYVGNLFGRLDVFIANLGSGKPQDENMMAPSEWERFYDVNVMGTIRILENIHPLMKEGINPSVTMISSIISREVAAAPPGYAAAKSAVRVLSKYLSRLWEDDGIRVNCVMPGNIFFKNGRWDELQSKNPAGVGQYIQEKVPMKRFGKPEEVADMIVFLASERASFITGAEIAVDGGQQGAI